MGERLFVASGGRDRVRGPTSRGESVPRAQSIRVICAENLFPAGHGLLKQQHRLRGPAGAW